jgi:hypothetical protein
MYLIISRKGAIRLIGIDCSFLSTQVGLVDHGIFGVRGHKALHLHLNLFIQYRPIRGRGCSDKTKETRRGIQRPSAELRMRLQSDEEGVI